MLKWLKNVFSGRKTESGAGKAARSVQQRPEVQLTSKAASNPMTSRAASNWKWVVDNQIAVKTYDDGSSKSCSIEDPELAGWLADGNIPELSKTVEQLAYDIAQNIIDPKTDELLKTGFMWNGIRFSADLEHQVTYKTAAELVIQGVVPSQTIKGVGAEFVVLDDTNASQFWMVGLVFVQTTLSDGWAIKYGGQMSTGETRTALTDMTHEQLDAFVDPR